MRSMCVGVAETGQKVARFTATDEVFEDNL